MSYLAGAYAFAIFSIAGYIYYLVRQARETAARIRELEKEQASGGRG